MSSKSSLSIVILTTVIGTIGIALPYPILSPLFLNADNSINQFMAVDPYLLLGLILATYPLGLLLSSSYLGRLSDRHGRKPVLVWTLFLSIFTNILSAWAITQESYLLLCFARFMTGSLEGNIAVARAIVTDLGNKINKTQAFGFVTAASYAGWFIGPMIGGYLSDFGFQTPFWIAAAISLVATLITWKKLDDIKPPTYTNQSQDNLFWHNQGLLVFIGIHFFATLAINIFYEFYPAYFVTLWQSTPQTIAHATMLCTMAMVLCSTLILKPAEHRFSKVSLYSAGVATFGVFTILLTIPKNEFDALLLFIPIGFFIPLYNSIAYAWFSERFQHLQQGRLMGALVSTFCLANLVAALGGSWLASFNVTSLIISSGAISIVVAILFSLANIITKKMSAPQSPLTKETSP